MNWTRLATVSVPPPVLPPEAREPIRHAVRILLDEADRYYASADRGLALLGRRSAVAVSAARRIYAEIGQEIRRRDFDVFSGRAVVGRPEWRGDGPVFGPLAGMCMLARARVDD